MLIFPAEPAHGHLSGRFDDRDLEDLAADFPMGGFALLLREIDERLIGDRLNKAVAQQIQRKAKRADRLCVRYALLNFLVRKSGVGANGAVIHERAAGDYFGAVSDGDFRIDGSVRPAPYGRRAIP